jgi:hypothetical protein
MRALEQFIIPERKESRGPVVDMYIAEDAC